MCVIKTDANDTLNQAYREVGAIFSTGGAMSVTLANDSYVCCEQDDGVVEYFFNIQLQLTITKQL